MDKRTRNSRVARLALAGAAGWLAYTTFQKWQAHKTRQATPDSDQPAAPEQSYSATVEGIRMRWEAHGVRTPGRPPVVMLHGIPTNPRIWRYVIPQLSDAGTCCLAWELVGFGWSIDEGLGRDISILRQAEYLYAWLKAQGIEQAVFVGHDVGGGVAQALLAEHPETVAGLVLVDSVAFDNWPVTAMEMAHLFHGMLEKVPAAVLQPIFHAGIHNLGHDDAERGEESAALLWEPYDRSVGPAGFANQARHMRSQDTTAIAARLALARPGIPVRLVWGEEDPLSIESAERLAELLAAPLRRIPGGRHFNPEDHPDVVADEIRSILGTAGRLPGRSPDAAAR